jgi:FKBP-type peptidyl-prolyl cis-trans isomerase 2
MRSAGSIPIIPVALMVVTIVVAASLGTYLVYYTGSHDPAGDESQLVDDGYMVSVEYIGMFEDGTVFDTSLQSVAYNDAQYPKALTFERKDSYSPMNFTVGSETMIKGFEDGIVGMYVGQTKSIVIPPEDGYGLADPLQISERGLLETVPVYLQGVNSMEFSNNYSVSPSVGVTVRERFWGWNVTVTGVDQAAGTITLKRMPDVGWIFSPHLGWESEVISIDESADGGFGVINVLNHLTPADANMVLGIDENGDEFRLVGVDLDASTYTVDYNREVVGRTLVFRVTVLSATKISE